VIAMTASALAEDRERCMAAGMDDYITKPLAVSDLGQALSRWVVSEPAVVEPVDPSPVEVHPVLRRLAELRGDDTPESLNFLGELAASFLERAPALVEALGAAVDQQDATSIEEHAHTLKGAAGNLGASDLAECAAELEELARAGRSADTPRVAARLGPLLGEVSRTLQAADLRQLPGH
jgi:HPt (histidine-containing phosphotransfer) domain-containing protein